MSDFPKAIINGLNEEEVQHVLAFLKSKIYDPNFVIQIEIGGNECNLDWIKDNMDISGDDMMHEIFESYGDKKDNMYWTLNTPNFSLQTTQIEENWKDFYYYKNN